MPKDRTAYRCRECGATAPRWEGRCHSCGDWNTLVEEARRPARAQHDPSVRPGSVADVPLASGVARSTDIEELDRVLGGGVVPGSVTLLGGEPGIGKSTLAMQLAAAWPAPVLYVSAEESQQQVKGRALRLTTAVDHVWIASETSVRGVVAAIDAVAPELVLVDSIQTIADERVASSPGSATQVRECAQQLAAEAKRRNVAVLLIGHVTKDGALAGPRLLEHLVDTVLCFEGDRHHALRILRASKHRFGSTDEIGLFE